MAASNARRSGRAEKANARSDSEEADTLIKEDKSDVVVDSTSIRSQVMARTEQAELHPIFRLKYEEQRKKYEAELIRRRSALLASQQEQLAKDIKDMEAAANDAKTIVADYGKKETNLRVQYDELRDFAKEEHAAIKREFPKVATSMDKTISDLESQLLGPLYTAMTQAQELNEKSQKATKESLEALNAAQQAFDQEKEKSKALSANLDGLRPLREEASKLEDPYEKYVLVREIQAQVEKDLPVRRKLEMDLTQALSKLLIAKANYHEQFSKANEKNADMLEATADYENRRTGRMGELRAAAKGASMAAMGESAPANEPQGTTSTTSNK
jgi:hypothetical protein